MKTLKDIIIEKLRINKETTSFQTKDIEDLKKVDMDWHAGSLVNAYNYRESGACMDKMKKYFDKNSKPLTLVHTIKDRIKLVQRFICAVFLQWDDAILVFKDEIITREIMTEDNIDAFFCKMYLDPSKIAFRAQMFKQKEADVKDALEHYLDLYHIKH